MNDQLEVPRTAEWLTLSETQIKEHRDLLCPHYRDCLAFAVVQNWKGWTCLVCPNWKGEKA